MPVGTVPPAAWNPGERGVLPAGFAWSISPDSAGWSIADGKLVLAPTTMAAGAMTTVHVIAPTDKEDCGAVTNTASVTTANDGSDTDDAKVEVLCGMVDLEKLADADSVTAGDHIGFTLKVTNKGLGPRRDGTMPAPPPGSGAPAVAGAPRTAVIGAAAIAPRRCSAVSPSTRTGPVEAVAVAEPMIWV